MKRPLAIVGQDRGAAGFEPVALRVGETEVRVADTGDGGGAAVLADLLVAAGAERSPHDSSKPVSVYIVVWAPTTGSPSNERMIEGKADFVLGSPRPAFARLLVEELRSSRGYPASSSGRAVREPSVD